MNLKCRIVRFVSTALLGLLLDVQTINALPEDEEIFYAGSSHGTKNIPWLDDENKFCKFMQPLDYQVLSYDLLEEMDVQLSIKGGKRISVDILACTFGNWDTNYRFGTYLYSRGPDAEYYSMSESPITVGCYAILKKVPIPNPRFETIFYDGSDEMIKWGVQDTENFCQRNLPPYAETNSFATLLPKKVILVSKHNIEIDVEILECNIMLKEGGTDTTHYAKGPDNMIVKVHANWLKTVGKANSVLPNEGIKRH